jgi:hypothetical protein
MSPSPDKRPAFEPAARLLQPTVYDPQMPRPAATIAGGVLVLLRIVAGALVLVAVAAGWSGFVEDAQLILDGADLSAEEAQVGLAIVLGAGTFMLLTDLVLAIFLFRGHNWARMWLMIITTFSISTTFVAWWARGQEITLQSAYLSLALDILILLALSSRSAAAYARRNERR